jgi:hypothetical protein
MTTATLSAQAIVSGGLELAPAPFGVTLPSNTNAAPPQPFSLSGAGNFTIMCPSVGSGYTVNGCIIVPELPASTNAKFLKGIAADTGAPFTTVAICGAAAGGSFVIQSTSAENLRLVWF